MSSYYADKSYEGPETIVVAMDIGTTHSAVSFTYLCPGSHPQGKMVAHWPGQAHWNGAAKIPSVVSYRNGTAHAYGMDAQKEIEEHADKVAYWFKLHLHPASMLRVSGPRGFEIPPLPLGISIERVYEDLMRYLMENTKRFFGMTTPGGEAIWARLKNTMVIMLATPNGWDIKQQDVLRRASIKASLVTEDTAGQFLQFLTEAEASVHYALANQSFDWLKKGTVFAVIDCGGSTVDTTVYRCTSAKPLKLEETCPSECVQAGGIFVDREVKKMLKNRLQGTPFGDPEVIRIMTRAFERELKPSFDGVKAEYDLIFSSIRENDAQLGIHKGRLTLQRESLTSIFNVVTDQIVNSCLDSLIEQRAKCVVLVGGFAESPYVRHALWKVLNHMGIDLVTVGDYAKKAAAEGAIISYIKQAVVARVVKATFGGCVREKYNKQLHSARKHTVQIYADGKRRVDGAFHAWIKKGTILQGAIAYQLPYHLAWDINTPMDEIKKSLGTTQIEVFAWEGDNVPIWCKDERGHLMQGMRPVFTLTADLSALAGGLHQTNGFRGKRCYRVNYLVCVYFGGTQLRATLRWQEKGGTCESAIKVISDVS
ncbi:hypothetical protein M408DRAFT_262970 [Serendipita vermifera MAFF 305830]|uniref:Uncharacterized protein n=1 Tax=Serendipita vermifera MAFF 305830 TaxID=933852 RepID=A0A0C2X253_SERVB|nr:hypothetical protein M408DRAFT_262970 [Serendipita vermifera MAFF 305830]